MGQKVNPISLRLEKTNRHFDSCWYDDYNYTDLLLQDLKIKNYLKIVLNQIKYPEGRIRVENLPNKSNIYLFYCNPSISRQKKRSTFQLQNINKNRKKRLQNNKPKNQTNQRYWKDEFTLAQQSLETWKNSIPLYEKSDSKGYEESFPRVCLSRDTRINHYQNSNLYNTLFSVFVPKKKEYEKDKKGIRNAVQSADRIGIEKVDTSKTIRIAQGDNQRLIPSIPSVEAKESESTYSKITQTMAVSFLDTINTRFDTEKKQKKDIKNTVTAYYNPFLCIPSFDSHDFPLKGIKSHNTLCVPCIPSYKQKGYKVKNNIKENILQFILDERENIKPKKGLPFKGYGVDYLGVGPETEKGNSKPILKTRDTRVCLSRDTSKGYDTIFLDKKRVRERFFIRYLLAQLYSKFLQNKSVQGNDVTLYQWLIFFQERNRLPVYRKSPLPFIPSLLHTQNFVTKDGIEITGGPKNQDNKKKIKEKKIVSTLLYPIGYYPSNRVYKSYLEFFLCKQYHTFFNLHFFRSGTEKQGALFLVEDIIYYLERKIPFRRIKSQILKEIPRYISIKGIRVVCSGRVGGRSKKAQRSKTQSVKIGQTPLGVFSSKIDFASKSAYTRFGLIGVKVWVCYQ